MGSEMCIRDRRSGNDCMQAVEALAGQGRLLVNQGHIQHIKTDGSELEVTRLIDGEPHSDRFDIVANCTGAPALAGARLGSLSQLLLDGTVTASPGGRGLVVTDELAAAQGLFVLGPLLAGNVINDKAVWHTEH